MAEDASPQMPASDILRRRRWLPSLIWLIPIVTGLVGVGLIARYLAERGPVITISFDTAEGITAGKTRIRYKEVEIGAVESVGLAEDRSRVIATVQLRKEARAFTAADTRFWVVRPRAEITGISGLSTLLSGAYIGADPGASPKFSRSFDGLEVPPIVTRDDSGRQFALRASDLGSLDIGSPVYFRRIRVGQLAAYSLEPDGQGVILRIFVNAPYDQYVGANTRFWHASGFDVQLDASGFKLRTQSLATVVLGGIAFQAPEGRQGPPAVENTVFALAPDESAALAPDDGPSQTLLMYFNQSLRGLKPGAPVDFRGVVLGEVKSIGVEFDEKAREFRMPVLVEIYPQRLRRGPGPGEAQPDTAMLVQPGTAASKKPAAPASEKPATSASEKPDAEASTPPGSDAEPARIGRLRQMIERGLRAQLRPGNLLTGQLYIALDFFDNASSPGPAAAADPLEVPTVTNSLDELQSQIGEIASKLNKVPYEEIAKDLRASMHTLDRTLINAEQLMKTLRNDVSPQIAAAMKDVRSTLASANKALEAASGTMKTVERSIAGDSPLQQDLRQTLREVSRSAESLRILTDYLEQHPESLLRGKPRDTR